MHLVQHFLTTRSVFVGKAVPLPWPQIQLTVSENRLTLAKSYFTGTAKQKNNSKACLSRKLVRKFNKWLFLSQCSHNWWSEMGMDVRQRFWFSELIVIRISWGGGELKAAGAAAIAPQDLRMRQHKQHQSGMGMVVKAIPSLVCHMRANWCIALQTCCLRCIRKCWTEPKWKTGTSLHLCIFLRGTSAWHVG